MKEITVSKPGETPGLIEGPLALQFRNLVTISVVMYEHQEGIPARFCAGLVPALKLADSHELRQHFHTTIRIIDPIPIVNHCNGWSVGSSRMKECVRRLLAECYPGASKPPLIFFDEAEPVNEKMLGVFQEVIRELESADEKIRGVVQQLKESGRRHGGERGEEHALLYIAAHPFSWLNFYHHSVWKRSSLPHCQYVNLMSRSEEPFSRVRRFLIKKRPDLMAKVQPIDRYMTVCTTPSYIPLNGEPMCDDVLTKGYDWCLAQYRSLKGVSRQHEGACRDFEMLARFVEDANY